ncbi:MAG: serine kinase [Caldilineaceae bacterium]|nr:serine kinase [Caldilineaceae bacterium]
MYFYQAFGLSIHSELALPELTATTNAAADVVIRLGKINHPRPESEATTSYCHAIGAGALCSWNELGNFWVQDGREVIIDERSLSSAAAADEELIRLLLLGPVTAILLYQRGFLSLHASAVAHHSAAVAFMGAKGEGKSTLAASLYAQGDCFLADDIVALGGSRVGECHKALTVLPGFPQFKLWPDAAASALGDDPDRLPRLTSGYDKRARRIIDGFSQAPVPLKQLYVLGEGPVPAIKRLSVREGLIQVMSHSYMARFGRKFLHGSETIRHMRQCTKLVEQVPIYALERPSSLASVSEIAQLVHQQLLEE